jgi:chromosome segregation ATPase
MTMVRYCSLHVVYLESETSRNRSICIRTNMNSSMLMNIVDHVFQNDQPVSFEVEQLFQYRNELLHSIEQFERSNSKLRAFLRHQYHLEAEHGFVHNQYDSLMARVKTLESENEQIQRLLNDRVNDNIVLEREFERARTQMIGFDTMKNSLEQNRAHLQRQLYAKEGEIHRLQCALRVRNPFDSCCHRLC